FTSVRYQYSFATKSLFLQRNMNLLCSLQWIKSHGF
ncbi:hypothetical protein AZ032_002430, partial [Klebsiella pneumoniae]